MLKIDSEIKLDFDDVLLVPQRSVPSSRRDVDLKRKFTFYHSTKEWHGIPLVASNMDTTGTFKMGVALNKNAMITCLHKHYKTEAIQELYRCYNIENNVWVSIGMNDDELIKLTHINKDLEYSPNICIDIANGYTEKFVLWCQTVRNAFPDSIIMAGNVCTPEMVCELILHGKVDIVKIGIGPGSACTTRLKTGCGYPQLSAISECAHVAHGLKAGTGRLGLICADGGCKTAGDVAKAYAAGADFVMLGGMFAGTEECEGEWEYDENDSKVSLLFYGMSSEKAQSKYGNGVPGYATSEGRLKKIPYKGNVNNIIRDILGGIRSACSYTGSTSLKDFSKTARFIRVNKTHYDQTI